VIDGGESSLGVPIGGLYGSTELFALVAAWPTDMPAERRARGGGKPVADDIEVRAVDPDTGDECAPGTVGELEFRGYNVLHAYLAGGRAQPPPLRPGGWFRSGDLGSVDPDGDGFVYVCRAGDALRLRGFLVEPAEIEAFLMSHPSVELAKVVGVRTGDGDAAVAFVSLLAGERTDAAELHGYCRARLAAFKVPARVEVIDEFPVTVGPNGTKVRTGVLREWAEESLRGA
jgi:fatty-acyl-CoA synthase